MGKGFGVAGIIVVFMSFFVPVLGPLMSMGALAIVSLGALFGERSYSVATTLLAGLNIFLLSPSWTLAVSEPTQADGSNQFMTLTILAFCLPFVGMLLNGLGVAAFRRRDD